MEQGLNAEVGEAQGSGPLAIQRDGLLHFLERRLTDEAVMTDALDVEQTSIGCEAYSAELIEVFDASADFEVASILLMVVSVRSAWPSLWYCLIRFFL